MTRFEHAIIIGGTGMLRAASVALARQSKNLTSIARTENPLRLLDRHVDDLACRHRLITQDYNRTSEFQSALLEAIDLSGPAVLVVAWIHDEDGPVPAIICEAVSRTERPCRIAHVMGSAAANPTCSLEERTARLSKIPGVEYQPVILGFHSEEEGRRSRWLTDGEISLGVLEAIEAEPALFVVGQIRPWDRRPGAS